MSKPRTPRDKSRVASRHVAEQQEILEDALILCAKNDGECGGDMVEDYLDTSARRTLINDLAYALEQMGYQIIKIQPSRHE